MAERLMTVKMTASKRLNAFRKKHAGDKEAEN